MSLTRASRRVSPLPGMREPYAVGSFRCKDGYVSFLPLGSRMVGRSSPV